MDDDDSNNAGLLEPQWSEAEGTSDDEPSDVMAHTQIGSGSHQTKILSYVESKWQRLRSDYSDAYTRLVGSSNQGDDSVPNLEGNQIGAVTWTSHEKSLFFDALDRYGRHDLVKISSTVGSKSEFEVREYLLLLQKHFNHRQKHSARTGNISRIDIAAAAEIGSDCEEILEKSADALLAYQEKYDQAAILKDGSEYPLIYRHNAEAIDAATNDFETVGLEADDDTEVAFQAVFHVSKFVELSERIFMNASEGSADWTILAEEDQTPAIYAEVFEDLFDIVLSLSQRIVQTSIFLAQSRIRSTSTDDYATSKVIRPVDVSAAIDILGLQHDSWDFWAKLASRSGLKVHHTGHNKGEETTYMSTNQIEEALRERPRGRARSLSQLVSTPPPPTGETDQPQSGMPESSVSQSMNEYLLDGSSNSDVSDSDCATDTSSSETEDNSSSTYGDEVTSRTRYDRKRSYEVFGEEEDQYMELLDKRTRFKEEAALYEVLGINPKNRPNDDKELPRRPKSYRKTSKELSDWTVVTPRLQQWMNTPL